MNDMQVCTEEYEKPSLRRHAIIVTMAPMGSKLGHGVFPFRTKVDESGVSVMSGNPRCGSSSEEV